MTDLGGIAIGLGLYFGLKSLGDAVAAAADARTAGARRQAEAIEAAAARIAGALHLTHVSPAQTPAPPASR